MGRQYSSNRNWQLSRIHQLRRALGMDDEAYVEMLVESYGVKSSRDLQPSQRHELIGQLTEAAVRDNVWVDRGVDRTTEKKPTHQAMRRLRYHSLFCAVHRASLPAFVMDDGTVREGEDLRRWLIDRFHAVKDQPQREAVAPIPKSILRHLSESFINPLCNKWIDRDREDTAQINPAHFYFHKLSADQVNYLTIRWKEFQRVIEAESPDIDLPFDIDPQSSSEEN